MKMIQKVKAFLKLLRYMRPVTRYEVLIYRSEVAELLSAVKEIELINRNDVSKMAQHIQKMRTQQTEDKKTDDGKANKRGMFQ